jgi:hypothetical protein
MWQRSFFFLEKSEEVKLWMRCVCELVVQLKLFLALLAVLL